MITYIENSDMLRIMAKPRFNTNPHIVDLYTHMQDLGCEIAPFSLMKLFLWRPQILHIHWPDRIFYWRLPPAIALLSLLLLIFATKLLRIKVVYTCHNFLPKNKVPRHWIKTYFWMLQRLVDLVISPRGSMVPRLEKIFSRSKVIFIPLGVVPVDGARKKSILGELGLTDYIGKYAFIPGIQEATKRTEVAIKMLRALRSDLRIVVCGGFPDKTYLVHLQQFFQEDGQIQIVDRFLEKSELYCLMENSQFNVASQLGGTNSGVALLSLALRRPCFCATLGVARSVRKDYNSNLIWPLKDLKNPIVWNAISIQETAADQEVGMDIKWVAGELVQEFQKLVGSPP